MISDTNCFPRVEIATINDKPRQWSHLNSAISEHLRGRLVKTTQMLHGQGTECPLNRSQEQAFLEDRRGKHRVLSSALVSGGFQCRDFLYLTWISFKSLSCKFCRGSIKFCLTSMSRASLTSPSSRMASPTSIRARPVKHKCTLYISL